MKKSAPLLMLVLSLLLSACASSNLQNGMGSIATAPTNPNLTIMDWNQAILQLDAQNKYARSMPYAGFQETDTNYWSKDQTGTLHYHYKLEKQTHHMWSYQGNHYEIFRLQNPSVMLSYNNQLWWVEPGSNGTLDYYLYCCDQPIIQKQAIKRIDYDDIILRYPPFQYAIHRGNLFILSKTQVTEGTQAKERVTILASPLNASEEFTILFQQEVSQYNSCSMHFAGTKVYYSVLTCPTPGDPYYLTITSYDVFSGSYETVYSESGISEHLDAPWIGAQGQIYLSGFDYSKNTAALWKVENGKRLKVTSWEDPAYDMPYLFDGIAVSLSSSNGITGCDIRDFSGNILHQTKKLLPDEIEGIEGNPNAYLVTLVGGDQEKLILNLLKGVEEYEEYMVLLNLKTPDLKPTVLWHARTEDVPKASEFITKEAAS